MAEEQNIQPNPAIKEHAEAGLAKEITEVRKPHGHGPRNRYGHGR